MQNISGGVICAAPRHGNQNFHLAAASIWGMMALRLANEEILPFNYMSYAIELEVSKTSPVFTKLCFCRPVEPLKHRGQRKINIDILVTMET